MFNLNLHYNIDNDVQPLKYDPSTIYNMFGFDMYNEMMRKIYQVNENFVNIIQEFIRINMDLQDMKSILYSQTDIDDLKSRMKSMDELLRLYASNQFVNSDTAIITTDYSGVYPKLKFNVIGVEYDDIKNISLSTAYDYNFTNTGASYPISLSYTSKMLLNLINDNHYNPSGNVIVMLDRDLKNKQKLDIMIKPDYALYSQRLYFNMMFDYNNVNSEVNIFNVDLPVDLKDYYDVAVPENSTFDDSYFLNENIYVNCTDAKTGSTWCSTGYTELVLTEDIFKSGNTIYVQNLYFRTIDGAVIDFSGAYTILSRVGITITIDLLVNNTDNPELSLAGAILVGQPRISFYRGLQVSILRVNGENTSTFSERYNITYKII